MTFFIPNTKAPEYFETSVTLTQNTRPKIPQDWKLQARRSRESFLGVVELWRHDFIIIIIGVVLSNKNTSQKNYGCEKLEVFEQDKLLSRSYNKHLAFACTPLIYLQTVNRCTVFATLSVLSYPPHLACQMLRQCTAVKGATELPSFFLVSHRPFANAFFLSSFHSTCNNHLPSFHHSFSLNIFDA